MAEEQTIMCLANDTRKLLNALEGDLDGALRRGVSDEQSSGVRAQNPSVVGEIIELMEENNKRLADLSNQVNLGILIKLDQPDKPAKK